MSPNAIVYVFSTDSRVCMVFFRFPFNFSSLSAQYYTMEFFCNGFCGLLDANFCQHLFTHTHTLHMTIERYLKKKIVRQLFGRRVRQARSQWPVHLVTGECYRKIMSIFQRNGFGASFRELI